MVDTGYWYAVCDRRDAHHRDAVRRFSAFESYGVAFPWPCLYKTLNTSFVENRHAMARFAAITRLPRVERLDDAPYRDEAYGETMSTALTRPISLVDTVMRLMLDDVDVRVNGLLTFNRKDFYDVCRTRGVEML